MFGSFLAPSSTVWADESQERTKILLVKLLHLQLFCQVYCCVIVLIVVIDQYLTIFVYLLLVTKFDSNNLSEGGDNLQ